MNRTHDNHTTWLSQIVGAALSDDKQRLQVVLLNAIRTLRKDQPALSAELGNLLAQHAANPSALRGTASSPPPTEREEGMALVRVVDVAAAEPPVLDPALRELVDQFLEERRDTSRLLQEGFTPPSSLLLIGAPGTGKTMLARWIARQLELPLVVQDLATSISSLLGKTGFNLRRTLDYARATPCVLLLDEFDAIAKRRDDGSELGELKRIVNVLLKELEEWPIESVLIAATNHPDLLDPAINRRFHLCMTLKMPSESERAQIITRSAGRFVESLPHEVLAGCAAALTRSSGSDIDRLTQSAVRRHLSRNTPMAEALISEVLAAADPDNPIRQQGMLMRAMQNASDSKMTVRELAKLFKKSVSTVQHHLKKEA